MTKITKAQWKNLVSTPAEVPDEGNVLIYLKAGQWYYKDEDDIEHPIGSSGATPSGVVSIYTLYGQAEVANDMGPTNIIDVSFDAVGDGRVAAGDGLEGTYIRVTLSGDAESAIGMGFTVNLQSASGVLSQSVPFSVPTGTTQQWHIDFYLTVRLSGGSGQIISRFQTFDTDAGAQLGVHSSHSWDSTINNDFQVMIEMDAADVDSIVRLDTANIQVVYPPA